jgi:hypothetical protein
VILAILIYFLAPSSKDRRGSRSHRTDDTPLAASRVAEETHHAARIGAAQGEGFVDGVGPFTGTMPRRKNDAD